MKIRMITDSASGMVNGMRDDVTMLPLTVSFGKEEYQDGINLSQQEFYEKLIENEELPTTSQIPPSIFEEAYEKLEKDEIAIVITLSSKLSGTYQSAVIAAQDYAEQVFVVDSESAAMGERALIEYALRLKEQGRKPEAIVNELEKEKKNIHLVALLDTLEYLKKGGRISKTAAFAGGLLSIKPVISLADGEVVVLGKARGSKQGNNFLVEQIHKAGGIDFEKPYFLGYSGLDDTLLQKYIKDSEALWKDETDSLPIDTISGVIGTHAGPGAIAVAFFARVAN